MPRNKQPFYHRMEVLFTATEDLSEEMNTKKFKRALAQFFRSTLGKSLRGSVEYDAPVSAEPGDPHDLM
jgi:hypothetical protein